MIFVQTLLYTSLTQSQFRIPRLSVGADKPRRKQGGKMDDRAGNRSKGRRFKRGLVPCVASASLILAGLLGVCQVVNAQPFPRAPVHLIIPYPPGGATDLIGRQLGAEMSKRLGQQVVIENRGGAAGMIGIKAATLARPDGHTLALGTAGNISVDPVLEKLPYNPTTDLVAVAPVVPNSFALSLRKRRSDLI